MISFSPDEIEEHRQEAINLWSTEDEQGNADPGYVLEDNLPGTFSYHEALHTAHVLASSVDAHLLEHKAVVLDPDAFKLAHEAHTALVNLYSHLADRHL